MNKKLIPLMLFITVSVIFSACRNKQVVTISGLLSNHLNDEFVYLEELKSENLEAVDSVRLSEDGSFSFQTDVKTPAFYLLKLNKNNFLTILVEPGKDMMIKAHRDSLNYPVSVEGSEGTRMIVEYNKKLRSTINRMLALNRIYEENKGIDGLPELMESLDSMAQGYLNGMNIYTKEYIDKNINSLVSLVALYQQVAPGIYVLDQSRDWQYFAKVDSSLFMQYPDYEPVKTLHRQVGELLSVIGKGQHSVVSIGSIAPEIVMFSPEGDTVSLSSTRGSVVLLDFWASWCGPCRRENPNLVKAYDTFHRKGFQIFQVSLDKTKDAWITGIKEDKLERWIHVSDIKYWKSSVVAQYKVDRIPMNFLLDSEGRIIASDLRGEELLSKLAGVFGK